MLCLFYISGNSKFKSAVRHIIPVIKKQNIIKKAGGFIGIKNDALQWYNSDLERYADLINGCIFKGKKMVKSEYLTYVPRKKSVIQERRNIPYLDVLMKFAEDKTIVENTIFIESVALRTESIEDYLSHTDRERDFIFLHNHPENRFYIACEGQADSDYAIPLREFMYDAMEYTDQLKSKRHKVKIDESTKYILPVFHMVLYHGWNQWKSKHRLQEMMYISEEVEEFIDQVTDYQSYIIDIHEQEPELFTTEWADIFRLMRHSRKKEELKKYVDEHMDELKMLSKDTRMLLAVLLDQYEIMKDGKVEVKDMCEAWDGAMQMYAEEAAEKEREKVIKEEREKAEKAERRLRSLFSILAKEHEYEKLNRAFDDADFCQELYMLYGI